MRAELVTLAFVCLTASALHAVAGTLIGPECKVPSDPRQEFARWVRFRPGDGQVVTLNPPRFSWPYVPHIVFREGDGKANQKFTLQISKTKSFAKPEVEVKDTACNFYNFLPPLAGSDTWYWRVGYNVGTKREKWSDTRKFTIAENAVVWDRSRLKEAMDSVKGHPRILLNRDNLSAILGLRKEHPFSKQLASYIINTADKTLKEKWFRDFPQDDKKPLKYMGMGRSMVFTAFAYLLTGDEKYLACKERFLRMASWPKGGYASPEGAGAVAKWESHLTEYFGLFYDWFYDKLTPAERAVVRKSLEWRIDHTTNSYAWRRKGGEAIRPGSIAVLCSSHPYENTMVTLPGALAICDESRIAREALELDIHYLIGITSGMGEDEGWNEGPGYGNGKMKWLTDATWYMQTAIPDLDLGKNEYYSNICDFFARITPVGAKHCSFGNRGHNERDWCASRVTNFRRMAMLRGDGHAMQNWIDTRKRLADMGRKDAMPYSPWIDYVLPHYAGEPKPLAEDNPVKLFPLEGWVMASSAPPSDYDAQKNAVSMTFHCRPRGGYSHSFRSENTFDIHAYGETITTGGGTTSNQSFFANHTMSHNTILVNGREQLAARSRTARVCGRIIAFRQGDNFVYWAGDATPAYDAKTGLVKFVRHVLFVDNAYFVIFDDLAMGPRAKPATFQWLYHVVPPVPLEVDTEAFAICYAIGKTHVVLQHLAHVDDLTFENLRGAKGMVNPITGENTTVMDKWMKGKKKRKKRIPKPLDAHHLWISNKTPRRQMQFLTVIAPFRKEEQAPTITRVNDAGVRVTFRGKETVVSFDKDAEADIAVDITAIQGE